MPNTSYSLTGIQDIPEGNKKIKTDIQRVSHEALTAIFEADYLLHQNIPNPASIVPVEQQTPYYKQVKKQAVSNLFSPARMAIIEGPTGTGKTTMARTIAYESGLEFYEDIGDSDKPLSGFLESIKTINSGGITQVKKTPSILFQALTRGGMFCLNEANLLDSDELLAFANLIENGFFIWDNKKYLIHPNFCLTFTSNKGYSGTQGYNTAVKRKAGGVIMLDYETDIDSEKQLIGSIYLKIRQSPQYQERSIDNETLDSIATSIFQIRQELKNKEQQGENYLTEDLNPYYEFFNTRIYEYILERLLLSGTPQTLSELIQRKLPEFVENGSFFVGQEYVHLQQDASSFHTLLGSICNNQVFSSQGKEDNNTAGKGFTVENSLLSQLLTKKGIEHSALQQAGDDSKVQKKHQFNSDLFTQVQRNRNNSTGKALSRPQSIEDTAMQIYRQTIESQRQKDIEIQSFKDNTLFIHSGGYDFSLMSEDEETLKSLQEIGKEKNKELFQAISGNKDIQVQVNIPNTSEEGYYAQEIENPFGVVKSFDIRRRSKILELEKDDKKYISFFGFSGNKKDIRYIDEDDIHYIPQSKASDIIFTLYEISNTAPQGKGHCFIQNRESGEIEKIKKTDFDAKIHTFLKKVEKETEAYSELEGELFQRFSNVEKLGLENGAQEKQYTATPGAISTQSYDIHDRAIDTLGRNLEFSSPSTDTIMQTLHSHYLSGQDTILTGPSGTGKTSMVKKLAQDLNLEYLPMQIGEDFSEHDVKTNFEWNEGLIEETILPFLSFYSNGGVIELKEINMASFTTFLNQYMDNDGTINYKGKQYTRNPHCFIVMTRNPLQATLYPGTKPMSTAIFSRAAHISVPYLNIDETVEVISKHIQAYNPDLSKDIGEEKISQEISQIMIAYILPIRNKIDSLSRSQNESTSEQLEVLAESHIHLDKLIHIFRSSSNMLEIYGKIKGYIYPALTKHKALFSEDTDIKNILQLLDATE